MMKRAACCGVVTIVDAFHSAVIGVKDELPRVGAVRDGQLLPLAALVAYLSSQAAQSATEP